MNHRILLAKLHLYGIRGVPEDWLISYLTNRRQKVEVKSPNSTQIFFCDWYIEMWSSPGINYRACIHNMYK